MGLWGPRAGPGMARDVNNDDNMVPRRNKWLVVNDGSVNINIYRVVNNAIDDHDTNIVMGRFICMSMLYVCDLYY